jgi:hypothetical protein
LRDDHKGKNKSKRRPRRSGGHKKKERTMVAKVSDIDSSSFYSSSSSSDEDENWHKGKQPSKNINGMCFTAQGFCCVAHSSASKRRNKDDSDSDSEGEIDNDPSFLVAENARLNELLDNRDDVLRKTNKEKRAQIDSLKSAPIVTNEPECTDCSVFLRDLKAPIPTSCTTCEVNTVKNLELAHYVDHLQDENDELRKMMGWLSSHEP